MGEPFLSEIKMVAFKFAPRGWALCNGQIMQVTQNQALFSLLGTTYGGNGVQTFALPNLAGATPIHFGQTPSPNKNKYNIGQAGGEAQHTLSTAEIPPHTHPMFGSQSPGDQVGPGGNYLGQADQTYGQPTSGMNLVSTMVGTTGGTPHQNMQPYLSINFCICLQGIFPSRS